MIKIYNRLYKTFGPQRWWPAKTPFEVIIGAILTQNTSWANVEKAILNLKKKSTLKPAKIYLIKTKRLAILIKPAGYYNIKARRIKNFLRFLFKRYNGNIKQMFAQKQGILRSQLLNIKGIGPETADSILLYAGKKPVFVVDAYTRRILLRHNLIYPPCDYDDIQRIFTDGIPKNQGLFNEYHALLVKVGKLYCKKNKPLCNKGCPLNNI